MGHFSRENYVAAQISLPQGGKNRMVTFVFFFFFYIKYESPLLKERNLFRKETIGLGTQISLLPRKEKITMLKPIL
jgi:hypothetical protein